MRAMITRLILIGGLWTGAAQAANQLELRLVRAHDRDGISPQLQDVAPLLVNNLPFRGFELLAATRVPLPSRGQTIPFPERLTIGCDGTRDRLSVTVRRDAETLLHAVVALRTGVPVILGGFPDGRDRLLLVVVAR